MVLSGCRNTTGQSVATTTSIRFATRARPSSVAEFQKWGQGKISYDNTWSMQRWNAAYGDYFKRRRAQIKQHGDNTNIAQSGDVADQTRQRDERLNAARNKLTFPFRIPVVPKTVKQVMPFQDFVSTDKGLRYLNYVANLLSLTNVSEQRPFINPEEDIAAYVAQENGISFCKISQPLVVMFLYDTRENPPIFNVVDLYPTEIDTNISVGQVFGSEANTYSHVAPSAARVAREINSCEQELVLIRISQKGIYTGAAGADTNRIFRHRSMALLNKKTGNAIYFEPHMYDTSITENRRVPYHEVQNAVSAFLNRINIRFSVKNVPVSCPVLGIGSIQGDDRLCATWSLFGGMAFLLNPLVEDTAVITDSISVFSIARMLYVIFYFVPLRVAENLRKRVRAVRRRDLVYMYDIALIRPDIVEADPIDTRFSEDMLKFLRETDWSIALDRSSTDKELQKRSFDLWETANPLPYATGDFGGYGSHKDAAKEFVTDAMSLYADLGLNGAVMRDFMRSRKIRTKDEADGFLQWVARVHSENQPIKALAINAASALSQLLAVFSAAGDPNADFGVVGRGKKAADRFLLMYEGYEVLNQVDALQGLIEREAFEESVLIRAGLLTEKPTDYQRYLSDIVITEFLALNLPPQDDTPTETKNIGRLVKGYPTLITSVRVPDGVSRLKNGAFQDCSRLTSITMPKGVIELGRDAFRGCSNLRSLEIAETVTDIGENAFYGCSDLTAVWIPAKVAQIGPFTFGRCSNLISVRIPTGVTSIGDDAFAFCRNLVLDSLPDTVTHIGDGAFSGCESIVSLTIPKGIKEISPYAFYECSTLLSVEILGGLTRLQEGTFSDCITLITVSLPKTVTQIGEGVFYGCGALTFFDIPEGVTEIGTRAFTNCSKLVSLSIPNGITAIETETFDRCSGLKSIKLPDGLTRIGRNAFHSCTGLTTVSIPAQVNTIEATAFGFCSGLRSVTIPKTVTQIEKHTFFKCSRLGAIEIPNGVTRIGEGAFLDCLDLKTVVLPKTIINIDENAFFNCAALPSITIPENVVAIGVAAFGRCVGLQSLTLPTTLVSISKSAFEGCVALLSLEIPEGVTTIAEAAFASCVGLRLLTLSNGVTEIGDSAFENCKKLQSLTIPKTVQQIGVSAFENCIELQSLRIRPNPNPAAVIRIKAKAFQGCSGLRSVKLPRRLKHIEQYAFRACTKLTSIIIPEGVRQIGDGAFYGCSGLENVTIPAGVTRIGNNAFYGCDNLVVVTIPQSKLNLKSSFPANTIFNIITK